MWEFLFLKGAENLKVYIDNLTKLLYNKKRMLCRFLRFCVFVILVVAVSAVKSNAVTQNLSACISPVLFAEDTDEDEGKEHFLFCRQESVASGECLLTLALRDGAWLCGILLEISYPQNLHLLEVERIVGGDHAVVSCADLGDRVRVLLDSSTNVYLEGDLIRFRFSNDGSDDLQFKISNVTAYAFGEGELVSLRLLVAKDCEEDRPDVFSASVSSVALTQNNESLGLGFSVSLPSGCFAAGARVFLVDLVAHSISDFQLVGVVRERGFFVGGVDLLSDGKCCVIIEPLGYRRGKVEKGEACCYYIENGVLY